MNGIIFGFLIKLKNKLINVYRNSGFFMLCEKIEKWYKNSVETGLITSSATAYDKSDDKYHKVTDKIFSYSDKIIGKLNIRKHTDDSIFVSLIRNLFSMSLRFFGLVLIPWSVIGLIKSYVDFPGTVTVGLYVLLAVLGGILVLFNKNINSLLKDSLLLSKFNLNLDETNESFNLLIPILIGVVSGICSALFGIIPVILVYVLAVAFSVSVYSPFFVVVIFASVLPFMSTMVMVAFSLALVMIMLIKKISGNYDFEIKGSILNVYVALMCFVYVIGTVFSTNVMSSLKSSLVYIAFILSYFVIVKAVDSVQKLKIFIMSLGVFSIPVGLYGIYQKLTGFDNENTWLDSEMFEEIKGRVVSFFDNPNVFGEYLILLIILSVALIFISKKYISKAFWLGVTAILGISMIFTYSRGCWIGLIIAIGIFLFFINKKLFLTAVIVGFISLFFLPESIIGRIASVGNLADSSTSYRVFIWNGTIEMLKDFWVTGIGIGTDAFNAIYPRYAYSAISAPHPHNLYLLIMSETGIIGIVVFVGVILSLFNKLLYVIKRTENFTLKTTAVAIGSALTGFLVQGVFDNVWYNYRVFLLFWIIVAVGASVYNIYMEEKHID